MISISRERIKSVITFLTKTERLKLAFQAVTTLIFVLFVWVGLGALPVRALPSNDLRFEDKVIEVLRSHPDVILESVEQYQRRQYEIREEAKADLLSQFQINPEKIISHSPTIGTTDKKAILFEFSDFQCPYCATAHQTLSKFMNQYDSRVTLVYKHYPLQTLHFESLPAAKASWAAGQQNKFWEYHDELFNQQDQLGETLYVLIAQKLDLDLEKFDHDRRSSDAEFSVQKDIQLANQLGIDGTPTFIINGKIFSGSVELSELEDWLADI